jgi:predicted AAA+ superfamily ATPase
MERYLKLQILEDLNEKMVFLAGPRQVGKTTLSKSLSKSIDYLNWDIDGDRTRILSKEFHKSNIWIFDEIHKYKNWRNYLKGIFDKLGREQKILVTGSAKLDVLRKGGDSLQGRYHYLRLLPLSFTELKMKNQSDLMQLYNLSGFPEPFIKGSVASCNRWSKTYRERLVRLEVSSNEQFNDLATIEIMLNRLPDLVGGLLSINAVSEDIQVSHKTVDKWLQSLERLYAIFSVYPFGPAKIKAIKKSHKIFFYDWNAISDEGARFENFIAVHLQKWIYHQQDTLGKNLELRFYRDKYDREVDFVVTENSKPILFIECKLGDSDSAKGLKHLKDIYPNVRAMQLHLKGKKEYIDGNGIEHGHAIKLLADLI